MRMIARSRITAQGQISVRAEIRKKLGVGPDSLLEWLEQGEEVIVRRAGRSSFEDVHAALFPEGAAPAPKTTQELKEGIRNRMRKRHARD
jgi:bifunctional DNA-binding transcriptional regulator/antitoxin component of YhaV-PrlF toxin-antitoxin module